MNGAQAHLLVNHVPVLGAAFAAVLLGAGAARRSQELLKAGMWAFVLAALAALPAFLTGEGAESVLKALPGARLDAIRAHEEAAEAAFWSLLSLGAACGGALWHAGPGLVRRRVWGPLLLLASPVLFLLARAAHLGGLIRHVELLP
jgi:hypothetical protein